MYNMSVVTPYYKITSLNPKLTFPNSLNFKPLQLLSAQRRRRRGFTIRASATTTGSDYYSKLNLTRNATLHDIKTSYRKLARKYHPDMSKEAGAEEKFKEISAAYEVLSDDEKRSIYDRFGESGLQGEYGGPGGSSQEGVDPFEVFDAFFGGSNGGFGGISEDFKFNFKHQRSEDLDIRYDLFLSFEESIFGAKKDIEVSLLEACDTCNGSGAKSSNSIKLCSMCEGRGGMMNSQRTPFGIMSQVTKCSKCDGDGKIITDYCQICDGKGKVGSKQTISVVIPIGVSDQATMKVRGEGNFDARRCRGIAGDLFLVLHVEEKQGISREGLNLYSKVEIDYTDAILGTDIKVETVEGFRKLQIPPGIQPGDTVEMLNMGVPNVRKPSMRGSHHFVVNVRIPKETSDEERVLVGKLALLRSSSNHYSDPSRGKHEGIFDNKKGKHVPTHGNKSASSLWSRIKDFVRQRQSEERFASVSVSSPQLQYSNPNHMMTIFGSLVLALAFIATFTRRLSFVTVHQRKQLKRDRSCSDGKTIIGRP